MSIQAIYQALKKSHQGDNNNFEKVTELFNIEPLPFGILTHSSFLVRSVQISIPNVRQTLVRIHVLLSDLNFA